MRENVTRLSTFAAAIRYSRLSRWPSPNARATLMSSENILGPRIELRPALPQAPGAGVVKAAALAYEPAVTGVMGTPVSDGRMPTTPVPPTDRKAIGVNRRPLPAVS